jgi:hypothetical protein
MPPVPSRASPRAAASDASNPVRGSVAPEDWLVEAAAVVVVLVLALTAALACGEALPWVDEELELPDGVELDGGGDE